MWAIFGRRLGDERPNTERIASRIARSAQTKIVQNPQAVTVTHPQTTQAARTT